MYHRKTLLALLNTHATAVGRPPQEALVPIVTRLRPSYNVLSMLVVFSTSPITLLTVHNIENNILIATLLVSQTGCVCRGFSELAPLLAYLTIALQDSVINAGLNYTEAEQQTFGNLYTGYVQNIVDGNAPPDEVTAAPTSNESTGVFASLIANESLLGGAFLPVSMSD
jgi:hypothetical protein